MPKPPKLTAISGGKGGGSGPEDPMIERIEKLGSKVEKIDGRLSSIELTLAKIDATLSRMPKMSDYMGFQKEIGLVRADVAEMKGRFGGVEARMTMMPTTWNLLTFTIGAVLGSAGLAFTIARLMRP
jgi:hypothetical protein